MGQQLQSDLTRPEQSGRWRKLLPWHEPTRQAVTFGWWGWFPNIPRHWFGRVVWMLIVGGVSIAFGVFATVVLIGLLQDHQGSASSWSAILAFVLFLSGCLIFAWHFLDGVALARLENARLRELRAQIAQISDRVEVARQRILG